jgi:hypothetical protein
MRDAREWHSGQFEKAVDCRFDSCGHVGRGVRLYLGDDATVAVKQNGVGVGSANVDP